MARTKKTTDALLKEVRAGLERLVETARKEGRDDALAELRQVIGGGASGSGRGGGRRRKAAKPAAKKPAARKKKRKNPWEGLTDEQRLARINAILKGKGLPPRKSL